MLDAVGLDPDVAGDRRPHEFSGGQCQRICIARALVLDPKVLICDEPVSALDVSVQAQILNLLEDMKARYGLTMIFIAHDLAVVKNVSDRVGVMYLGKLCEVGRPDDLYRQPGPPLHPAAARVDPRARPPARRSDGQADRRRAAVADRPAVGLPVPHPLPARPAALRRGGAASASIGAGPLRGLPLPAHAERLRPTDPPRRWTWSRCYSRLTRRRISGTLSAGKLGRSRILRGRSGTGEQHACDVVRALPYSSSEWRSSLPPAEATTATKVRQPRRPPPRPVRAAPPLRRPPPEDRPPRPRTIAPRPRPAGPSRWARAPR